MLIHTLINEKCCPLSRYHPSGLFDVLSRDSTYLFSPFRGIFVLYDTLAVFIKSIEVFSYVGFVIKLFCQDDIGQCQDKCQPRTCALECIKFCPGVRIGDETVVLSEETGKPIISEELCTGCGICPKKCPYGAIYIDPETNSADKCTYCAHRVAGGMMPACVVACPVEANIFGDLDDPNSEVAKYVKKGAQGLTSKAVQIGPNTRYYGSKKDMALLMTQAPQELPEANLRRTMMAAMAKPVMKQAKNIGLAGLAGALLVQALDEDENK